MGYKKILISEGLFVFFRRLYVKKCGQLYDEKVNVELDRVKRVQSAKEVMQVGDCCYTVVTVVTDVVKLIRALTKPPPPPPSPNKIMHHILILARFSIL